MKNFNWLFALMFAATASRAQTPVQASLTMPQTAIHAALLGSLKYPGFKMDIERPFKVIQVERHWGRKSNTFFKERLLALNLGFYHQPDFHDNLYLVAECRRRRQYASGWFFESAPGIGYSRTFLGGATYRVSDDGMVSKKTLAGFNYALLSMAWGGGYNLSMKKNKPLKIYGKLSLIGLFPYNSYFLIRPTAELGAGYSLAHFWRSNPKIKIINKNKKK